MGWYQLDEQTKRDLLDWYNVVKPNIKEKEMLAKLYRQGRFDAWDCPECGERVYYGTPIDWAPYQLVNQADYTSYPGNIEKYQPQYIAKMCDTCRRKR